MKDFILLAVNVRYRHEKFGPPAGTSQQRQVRYGYQQKKLLSKMLIVTVGAG